MAQIIVDVRVTHAGQVLRARSLRDAVAAHLRRLDRRERAPGGRRAWSSESLERRNQGVTRAHTHTHIYIYICIYICTYIHTCILQYTWRTVRMHAFLAPSPIPKQCRGVFSFQGIYPRVYLFRYSAVPCRLARQWRVLRLCYIVLRGATRYYAALRGAALEVKVIHCDARCPAVQYTGCHIVVQASCRTTRHEGARAYQVLLSTAPH